MGARSKVILGIVVTAAVAAVSVPIAVDKGTCKLSRSDFNTFIGNLSESQKTSYINFVLNNDEGWFRESCHKLRVLSYIDAEQRAGRAVSFDASRLKLYVGLHMERKYRNLDYHETIRSLAVGIAGRTFDRALLLDAIQFYKGDEESERFLRAVAAPHDGPMAATPRRVRPAPLRQDAAANLGA